MKQPLGRPFSHRLVKRHLELINGAMGRLGGNVDRRCNASLEAFLTKRDVELSEDIREQ